MSIAQKANIKHAVKHITRYIARISNSNMGYKTPDELDAELSSLILQGYRIVNTHYLGSQIDHEMNAEYFGLLYILQLEQSEVEKMKLDFTRKVEKALEKEE